MSVIIKVKIHFKNSWRGLDDKRNAGDALRVLCFVLSLKKVMNGNICEKIQDLISKLISKPLTHEKCEVVERSPQSQIRGFLFYCKRVIWFIH